VGMCQMGALGRARAGQSYRQILAAYYPDTRIERIY
jgi:stage II sporulation protein D